MWKTVRTSVSACTGPTNPNCALPMFISCVYHDHTLSLHGEWPCIWLSGFASSSLFPVSLSSACGFMCRPTSPISAASKLESSAPPMDLDRPQGSSAQPLDLPLDLPRHSPVLAYPAPDADSTSAMAELAELAQSSEPSSTDPDVLPGSLKAAVATEPEALNQPALGSSDAESPQKLHEAQSTDAESAAEATEAEPAVAAESASRTEAAGGEPKTTLDEPVQLAAADKPPGRTNPLQDAIPSAAVDASGIAAGRRIEPSAHAGDKQNERQVVRADGQGERQVPEGADSGAEARDMEAGEEVLPWTEEDLDTAMQELAQEVRYSICPACVLAGTHAADTAD